MKRIVLGKTGLEVCRLGFGGIPIQKVDENTAVETVRHVVEKGVDFLTPPDFTPLVKAESERR